MGLHPYIIHELLQGGAQGWMNISTLASHPLHLINSALNSDDSPTVLAFGMRAYIPQEGPEGLSDGASATQLS